MKDQIKNHKTIWIITIVIVLLIALGVAIYFLQHSTIDQKNTVTTAQTVATTTTLNDQQLHDIAQQTIQPEQQQLDGLVDESLLQQPIAQDPALIKDELAQLDDIQLQLNDQKQILKQQHQDADELIKLKEQQIAQLEQQLQNSEAK